MKNASTVVNVILQHPQGISHILCNYPPFVKSEAFTAESPCPGRSTDTRQRAGVDFSQSTGPQNTISLLLYVLEIFSTGMMPSVTTNKTDVFPFTLVRKFHVNQFNHCTRNGIYMLKYPYRLILGKLS